MKFWKILKKDYSSSDSSFASEPDTSKFEEKYKEKGVDEEEAIKAMDKSDDEDDEGEGSEDDEGLTEAGKEMKKLMKKGTKGSSDEDGKDSDEFDDFFKNGKSIKKEDGKLGVLY